MNTILSVLIDLLGEVFPVARPTPVSGDPAAAAGTRRHDWLIRWGRRILGALIFALLTVLPFLVMRWLEG